MDIVLELVDTVLLDRLYAALLPTSSSRFAKNIFGDALTANCSSACGTPAHYRPSTQFFSIPPSQYAYMSALPRDSIWRQALSLYLITWLFGMLVYFIFASLSYIFIFDKATFTHPKYLKNQVRLEIRQAMISLPVMAILTVPFFLAEVRGYAKLYDAPSESPFRLYNYLQFPFFITFTDGFIYWIHRGLHHPIFYKALHKPHHKWIMPTPFASHAFHPVDGFAQSVPYHVFPFVFPLQKFAYIALFIFVNVWTIMIHDGEYVANSPIINGAACHSIHHSKFDFNYGQYTTLWDRIGNTYYKPPRELFKPQNIVKRD